MSFKRNLVLLLVIYTCHSFAQKADFVELRVIYSFKHVNNLNKPNQPFEEAMVLRLGKTESRYNSWTDEVNSKEQQKKESSPENSAPKSGVSFGFKPTVFVRSKGIQDYDLLQYPSKNKLTRIIKLGASNYLLESNMPTIDWKVYEQKKEIKGYNCQKAIGDYGGRTYVAWFTPDLPFRNGPWKLWGLPGLILEATDLTGQVSFVCTEINKSVDSERTAPRNTRFIKVSEKAFALASKAFERDPVSVYQSQLPIGNTEKADLVFVDQKGNFFYGQEGVKMFNLYKNELKQRKNNPLELIKIY